MFLPFSHVSFLYVSYMQKALAVAIHHLPPGYAVCVQNKRPVPESISGVAPPGKGGAASSGGAGLGGGHRSEAPSTATSAGPRRRTAQPASSAFSHSEPVEGGKLGQHYYWDDHASMEPEPEELMEHCDNIMAGVLGVLPYLCGVQTKLEAKEKMKMAPAGW